MNEYLFSDLTQNIIAAAIEVHSTLGPGLLESAYEECLMYELKIRNIMSKRQIAVPLVYKGIKTECGYRADIIVENKIILELKSVDSITDVHIAQILTYLKLSGCRVGLLINFNVTSLKNGIKRFIH